MMPASVGVARGILRNAGALFLVGLFGKGAGLVVAVLIARFLGADSMGLYAVLFSVSVLIEAFISLGMSDSLVRDVAARPGEARDMFVSALRVVVIVSILPVAALLAAAWHFSDPPSLRDCLLILALGTPVAGAFVVAQSVLQGCERVLLLTWVTFVARLASLALLLALFVRGASLAAAFASMVLFQLLALAVFAPAILKSREKGAAPHSPIRLMYRAVPFAICNAIRELSVRLPALVLPGSVGLGASGVFDGANRVRSALGMTMGASIRGLMPAFARSHGDPEEKAGLLIGYSVKYMCIGMSLAATAITLLAAWIVEILYGSAFAAAALPLQLLAWAQVLTAVDAVLQQAMLARGAVLPAIRHSAVVVALQFVLLIVLSRQFGLPGAAAAVMLASAALVAVDARYVAGRVARVPVWHFVAAPLLVALSVAAVMFATAGLGFAVRIAAAAASWAAAVVVFRAVPRDELRFMWRLLSSSKGKSAAGP